MNAMTWNPEKLLARHEHALVATAELIEAVKEGARATVVLEQASPWCESRHMHRDAPDAAPLREGCIKAVEAAIRAFPQRGRVLAELHRRLDHAFEMERGSSARRACLTAIISFAGAWTLAARLMQSGLSVRVIEGDSLRDRFFCENDKADVDIVIPIGPEGLSRSCFPSP